MDSADYAESCCIANCSSPFAIDRVDRNPCNVTITVTQRMPAPVYLYYKVDNMFQNHRRYLTSRDDQQLAAYSRTTRQLERTCGHSMTRARPTQPSNYRYITVTSPLHHRYITVTSPLHQSTMTRAHDPRP